MDTEKLDSITKKQLRQLIESSHFQSIYHFIAFITAKWHDEEVKADDQFNTVWNMAMRQGKVDGLKEFIEKLEEAALNE